MSQVQRIQAFTGLMAALVLFAACGRNTTKEEYLASGDAFANEQKYAEAILQYRNAVAIDPQYGEARYKLADAYARTREPARALAEYVRAADLMPQNTQAQIQAARFLLLAGRFEDAKTRAERALERDGTNIDALIAKAAALAGLKDMAGSIAEAEEAIRLDPDNARSHLLLGSIQVGQRNMAEAEQAFKAAVEADPTSLTATQALATFYWASNRPTEAEEWMRRAVALNPADLPGQRALTMLLLSQNRVAEAEAPLKAVAELTKTVDARLALADFYLNQRRIDAATPILDALKTTDEGFIPASVRLARLDYSSNRKDAAHQAIDEVLKRDAKQVDALVFRTEMLIAERKLDDALSSAQAAVGANQQAARAHTALGDAYAAKLDTDPAIREYNEALRINPRIVATRLKLARLQILKGDTAGAIVATEDAVKQAPNSTLARLMRARALMANGDFARAQTDLDLLAKAVPNLAAVHTQLGDLYSARQNRPAARKAYDQALAISPDSFEALRGRATVDILDGNAAQAKGMVERQLQKSPANPQLLGLMAAVHGALGQPLEQEALLNKLIEVDPNNLQGYAALASMYVRQGKLDRARERYETLTRSSATEMPARTMIGLIYEAQNRPAEAKVAYQRLLESYPESAVAANNLAWRMAEDGDNLDVALSLAQTAKRHLPESPEVWDTMGWIYYKKGLSPQAITEFQASVQAAPDNALFRYHLGLAHAKAGNAKPAAREFDQALKLRPDFKAAAEARRALPLTN